MTSLSEQATALLNSIEWKNDTLITTYSCVTDCNGKRKRTPNYSSYVPKKTYESIDHSTDLWTNRPVLAKLNDNNIFWTNYVTLDENTPYCLLYMLLKRIEESNLPVFIFFPSAIARKAFYNFVCLHNVPTFIPKKNSSSIPLSQSYFMIHMHAKSNDQKILFQYTESNIRFSMLVYIAHIGSSITLGAVNSLIHVLHLILPRSEIIYFQDKSFRSNVRFILDQLKLCIHCHNLTLRIPNN